MQKKKNVLVIISQLKHNTPKQKRINYNNTGILNKPSIVRKISESLNKYISQKLKSRGHHS